MRRKTIALAGAVALAMILLPRGASGQWNDGRFASGPQPLRGEVHFHAGLAVPVGEFGDHVNLGGGGAIGGLLFLDERGYAAIRADGSFVVYGHESYRTSLSPTVPFVDVDVATTNSIFALGVGPQVYLGSGPLRPYFFGTVGFSYFVTETSVSGSEYDEPFASTTNFDDFNLALAAGGGLAVSLREGENPVSLDLAAHYQHNGLTEYLTDGAQNLRALPRGGWRANPVVSDANLLTYRVGVSIGIR